MSQLLTAVLDVLFPPSAEELLVRSATLAQLKYEFQLDSFQQIMYLSHYQTPLIKACIKQNKFHHSKKAAQFLGTLLLEWHRTQPADTLYLPIPLGRKRQRTRGHNQVESILTSVNLTSQLCPPLLRRITETRPQAQLSKSERTKNLTSAFAINEKYLHAISTQPIVLVDDVVTTGATLRAAHAALAAQLRNNKVTLLAITH